MTEVNDGSAIKRDLNEDYSIGEDLKRFKINEKSALFTLKLSLFEDVLGYSMIMPLLPYVVTDMSGSPLIYGLMVASNAFMALVMAPIWGKLSDKYGRKKFLIICQFGTLAAFILFSLANSIEMLFFTRILDGLFGGQVVIVRSIMSDITDPDTRAVKLGNLAAVNSLGMIFGPTVGGLLGELSYKLAVLPDSPKFIVSSLTLPGLLASILTIIAIILTFRLLVETMPKERIVELKRRKSIDRNKMNTKFFTSTLLIRLFQSFLLSFAFGIFTTSLAFVMINRYAQGVSTIGFVYAVAGVELMVITLLFLKRFLKKFGDRTTLKFSIILMGINFLWFPLLTEFWMIFIFMIPMIIGMSFIRPILNANIAKAAPPDKQGVASGWNTNMMSVAQIIAPIISTSFLTFWIQPLFGIELSYYLIALLTVCTMIFMLILALIDIKRIILAVLENQLVSKVFNSNDEIKNY